MKRPGYPTSDYVTDTLDPIQVRGVGHFPFSLMTGALGGSSGGSLDGLSDGLLGGSMGGSMAGWLHAHVPTSLIEIAITGTFLC